MGFRAVLCIVLVGAVAALAIGKPAQPPAPSTRPAATPASAMPDLSKYDADVLRMLATNLYQKVDQLEQHNKKLATENAELKARLKTLEAVIATSQPAPTEAAPGRVSQIPPTPEENGQKTITNSIGMELAYIPPGRFVMGSPVNEEGRRDDEVQHAVRLTRAFCMGVTPVTQKQWKAVMGNNPSRFKGDDLPVETVSWHDAREFCRKLSQLERRTYRLPMEAEWEYACRAGTTTAYYTGSGEQALADAGWYYPMAKGSHPVGQKRPNAWGLFDMHGNVQQWCLDNYGDYPTEPVTDPQGPESGRSGVVRGGSFDRHADECRSASREEAGFGLAGCSLGFRVVLEIDSRTRIR